MMKVVIDTNVGVSYLLIPNSVPGQVIDRWTMRDFELIVSREIIDEYADALGRPHIVARHKQNDEAIGEILNTFVAFGFLVEPNMEAQIVVSDPDDKMVAATAIAGNADYIVTGDKGLLQDGPFGDIQVVTPTTFLALLEDRL